MKNAQSNMSSRLFRDLNVGDTFDFIDDSRPTYNSFYTRCVKTSARCYTPEGYSEPKYRVGSINAVVYHAA